MILQLDRVVFDHAPGAAGTDALSIRIDGTHSAPDWIAGATEPSRAAYALAPTLGQPLTIVAHVSPQQLFAPIPAGSLSVRALAAGPDAAVLGPVASTLLQKPLGSDSIALECALEKPGLWDLGVGAYSFTWRWQFQLLGGEWTDFGRSDHRVYITLDLPTAPWTQAAAGAPLWPWARVLEYACAWAAGVTVGAGDPETASPQAAKKMEAGLHALGQRSDIPLLYREADASDYTHTYPGEHVFYCTDFLALLDGNPAPGKSAQVNCSDCAAALVTFANALGCNLSQQQATNSTGASFRTNPIVAIGSAAKKAKTRLFSYHEFAVREPAGAAHVHDACFMIDRDADPFIDDADHRFNLAQGLALGALGIKPKPQPKTLKYAHRLVKPDQWDTVKHDAVPLRCLDACAMPTPVPIVVGDRFDRYLKQIEALSPDAHAEATTRVSLVPMPIAGFQAYDAIENPTHLSALKGLIARSVEFFYVATPRAGGAKHAAGSNGKRLRISVGYADSAKQARHALAWVLAQSDTVLTPPGDHAENLGAEFAGPRESARFFVRGNAVARLVNVGTIRVPLAPLAQAVVADFESRER